MSIPTPHDHYSGLRRYPAEATLSHLQIPTPLRPGSVRSGTRWSGDDTTTRLLLKDWIPGRYHIAPKGTFCILLDYPEIRVSLINGGIFKGRERGAKPRKWGVFLTAAIIFGKMQDEFPGVFEKVWGTLERIWKGELRFPESSSEEIRAYYAGLKAELRARWFGVEGLMTTVLRRAPTAKRLWTAVPDLHCHCHSPAYLLRFLRECMEWENETHFRITEKTYGRGRMPAWTNTTKLSDPLQRYFFLPESRKKSLPWCGLRTPPASIRRIGFDALESVVLNSLRRLQVN